MLPLLAIGFFAPQRPLPTAAAARQRAAASLVRASADMAVDRRVDCIVVGAGISGSTLAHNLHRGGADVLLAEARDYVGGNVVSHEEDLGIEKELVFADESLPPWVNHGGKLHPLPKGKGGKGPKGQLELVFGSNGVLKFGLSGSLLSWPGKIRAAIGALVGHAPPPEGKEETIREWVTRTLGEEVFLRCIDPFVSGVYAGDPMTLSMSAALSKIARIERYSYGIEWNKLGAIFYGGLARQVELTKERKASPPDPAKAGDPGLSTLPHAIAAELGQPHGAPPDPASRVLPGAAPLTEALREGIGRKGIYYPPVAAVTVAYPKSAFRDVELDNGFGPLRDLPGFGSLNPRSEGVRTLGTLWSSSLFPGRCPPEYNLLLNYIGGSRDAPIAELSEEVLLKPDAPPPKVLSAKLWPTAIPQYELGHAPLIEALERAEADTPGLWEQGQTVLQVESWFDTGVRLARPTEAAESGTGARGGGGGGGGWGRS
ncbi:hypothetical protein EMIHUDRAFT_450126 [Emiliania huxleyi CCMP1516]|uniref:protoporphyrinogen oxidase n=2 Tax=Emiliania huxleyi TaxID=2903 RepID=A0A0D3JWL1_EMIH1|nr:hypothetical protein EMIHUDRAFT_450126 [Emiliania huxleyi CCMP1516]EOD27896.1 hypothetical protein EMIHUDRAFT_450126 [Emiliania huxleyi CCMP1516]|eukprot:XP_005780325.1 hypothetical protein EMIHUDRAFT_450126 [Emiliania huxleyi CCMP1516]